MNQEIWWSPVDEPGLEHLNLRTDSAGVVAEGLILRVLEDRPFRIGYRILCDRAWQVREVEVELQSGPGGHIKLIADGAGKWTDASGKTLREFEGCLDVDILATPFTNSLPIRRAGLKAGESIAISVVYLTVPEMKIERSRQQYTCLKKGFYRFEEKGLFDGFSADLQVDENDLVIDYPDLFKRIGT